MAQRPIGGGPGAEEDLGLTGGAEQAVGAVPGQQLVPSLFVDRPGGRQELGREQALDEVVDAAIALAAGKPEGPRLGQRLEDRPDRVGGPPVPIDRRPRLDVGGR